MQNLSTLSCLSLLLELKTKIQCVAWKSCLRITFLKKHLDISANSGHSHFVRSNGCKERRAEKSWLAIKVIIKLSLTLFNDSLHTGCEEVTERVYRHSSELYVCAKSVDYNWLWNC